MVFIVVTKFTPFCISKIKLAIISLKGGIKMKKIFFLLTLILTIVIGSNAFAITDYEKLDFVTGIVTASALNVRTGPSTNYKVSGLVYKNEYVRVFAKVGSWYVIQTEGADDPHVWLSLKEAMVQCKNIKDILVKKDPDNKEYYEENYEKYISEMESLYNEYKPQFDSVNKKNFVTPILPLVQM